MTSFERDNGIVPAGEGFSTQRVENRDYPVESFAEQDEALYSQVTHLIDESHARASAVVNAEITELYWQVGDAINKDLLDGKRAEYGSQVMQTLSSRLTVERGRGWSVQQLWHCRRLASTFSYEIISALRRELNWTCIRTIMYIDGRDYYIDLLFFHRRLRRLVAIELKLGDFEASFKGQMELYLRWLERYEMVEGENPPIGLILCSGKNDEHVELLGLDEGSIRVAEYLTKLPDMDVLEEKLRLSIERARRKLEAGE